MADNSNYTFPKLKAGRCFYIVLRKSTFLEITCWEQRESNESFCQSYVISHIYDKKIHACALLEKRNEVIFCKPTYPYPIHDTLVVCSTFPHVDLLLGVAILYPFGPICTYLEYDRRPFVLGFHFVTHLIYHQQ